MLFNRQNHNGNIFTQMIYLLNVSVLSTFSYFRSLCWRFQMCIFAVSIYIMVIYMYIALGWGQTTPQGSIVSFKILNLESI